MAMLCACPARAYLVACSDYDRLYIMTLLRVLQARGAGFLTAVVFELDWNTGMVQPTNQHRC